MADRYVIDTVAFIHHLTDTLPEKVENIFKRAENGDVKLILPSISIGEAIYVFKDLEVQDWKNVAVSKIPELHDRMVVATARKYKVPLITNDGEIYRSEEVKTIWK